VAQVGNVGPGDARCRVVRFWNEGRNAIVEVACASPRSTPVDGAFTVIFTNLPSAPPAFAYAWVSGVRRGGSSADLVREYQFNSAGGLITGSVVQRGDWQIRIPRGAGLVGGVVHATPYGTTRGECTPRALAADGADAVVRVTCAVSGGIPYDLPFVLSVAKGVGLTGTSRPAGYVSLNGANPVSVGAGYPAVDGRPIVTRTAIGRHTVRFRGLATPGGSVHVSPRPVSPRGAWPTLPECRVLTWRADAADEVVDVACVDQRGSPFDAAFDLSFTH